MKLYKPILYIKHNLLGNENIYSSPYFKDVRQALKEFDFLKKYINASLGSTYEEHISIVDVSIFSKIGFKALFNKRIYIFDKE